MKLGGWMMMMVAMVMFISLVGIPTPLSGVLEPFGMSVNPDTGDINANLEGSGFWQKWFHKKTGLLVVLGVGAVIIGLFARSYDPSLTLVPFIIWVAPVFVGTGWTVIQYIQSQPGSQTWMVGIVGVIFGTLSVGFIMACIDYFAGR